MPEVLTEDDVLAGMHRVGAPETLMLEDAERLIAWADDESIVLEDGFDRSTLLVFASGQLGLAGRHDEAIAIVDQAIAVGPSDRTGMDLRAYRVMALGEAGRADEALATADTIRRSRPREPFVCEMVAESLAGLSLHAPAERWCSIGLRILEDDDPEGDSVEWDRLLRMRRDARAAQGKPQDAYDEAADAVDALTDEGF